MAMTRDILWCGLPGQGAFTTARVLGAAFALSGEGRHALVFPSPGPARADASVRVCTRLSDAPIRDRGPVDCPDHVVCLDEEVINDLADVQMGEGGSIILANDEVRVFSEQAAAMPFVNMTLLSLLAFQLGDLDEDALDLGIREAMPAAAQQGGIELVRAVFEDPYGLRMSAVHIVHMPAPKPHEQNRLQANAEYLDLSTADGFFRPHKEYRPGQTSEEPGSED